MLKEQSVDKRAIHGYDREEATHAAVGILVREGIADVGVAIYAVAKIFSLDFIPLAEEEYDLLVTKAFMADQRFDTLMEAINSKEFSERLNAFGGYNTQIQERPSMLRDNFDRIINYLRISITDRCNLRCKYCTDKDFPFIPHDQILAYEEIVRFVKICAGLGVKKVRLTGGEPLTRRNLPFLVSQIGETPGIEDISLTTNGVFLPDRIDELKEAGLTRVNISLDTLKPGTGFQLTSQGSSVFHRLRRDRTGKSTPGLKPR